VNESIDYAALLRRAVLGLVREVLIGVESRGLPGEHHLYLTFQTEASGVEIPAVLRRQYPETMTIVLQNQFWDLVVEPDAFAVTLRFAGEHSRLRIPFEALTGFLDPSVPFGLDLARFSAVALGEVGAGGRDDASAQATEGRANEPGEGGGDVLPFRPRES